LSEPILRLHFEPGKLPGVTGVYQGWAVAPRDAR